MGSKGPHPPLRNLRGDLLPVCFRFARLKGDPERGDQIVFAYRWHGFVAFLFLLLTSDRVPPCLSLKISTLFSSVMFHVNLTASIPPVGYLALADRFMITSFSCSFFFQWGGHPLLCRKRGKKGLGPAGLPPGPRFHSPSRADSLPRGLSLARPKSKKVEWRRGSPRFQQIFLLP